MRILVNALPARDGGGITYLIAQIRALEVLAPDVTLDLLVSPWGHRAIAGSVRSAVRQVNVRTVADRFAFEQTLLVNRARNYDVLYCPLNFGPTIWGGARAVLTLHNPNYFGTGLTMSGTEKARPWIKVKACHSAIRQSAEVVAISDSFRDEVVGTIPSVRPKLNVIKSGRPDWDQVDSQPVPDVPSRFILAVGSSAPHKRLDHVVIGWKEAIRETGEDISLVIAAGVNKESILHHTDIAGEASGLLVHLGRVDSRSQLRWLYEHATALVSMSVLEAFPLVPSEAGALGCPLVLSDIPPHREVTMGNATFAAPNSPSHLASLLPEAFMNEPGSRRWEWPITWEQHAASMLSLFERAGR